MSSALPSPLDAYRQALARGELYPDAAQQHAAECLELCRSELQAGRPCRGVYLWGPVGRGKTWLLDRFHESLTVPSRRQHFHQFMRWVHQRQFQLSGTADPLRALARELASEVRVLCFDELFISDIGDAMLIGGLLSALLEEGLVLVATSNQPPQQLYAGGFNRERLLPAITALQAQLEVVEVDGGQDHRLHPGQAVQRYWIDAPEALAEAFAHLAGNGPMSSEPLQLGPRQLPVVRQAPGAVWLDFTTLCEGPYSALDFMQLCERFPALLVGGVPCLSGEPREGRIARGTEDAAERVVAGDRELPSLAPHDDAVRRFIALVDECYDRRRPLYLEAAVPMEQLYTRGYLEFPFRRTLSRLREMQQARY
ncbi:cell division protein ZapE [Pseudomonas sp. PDM16]|uniref:cell division protein ZapE n=1 Tax=Pseudomonas sp. PDM16 TaxID=2769292 RepID=UPI0017829A6F|nr:cell division protein ZapE [Pseudomonas sp. PDM16]MBD9415605.1 cell division protein ZapE [Pseudomonas sp. PDM16]